MGKVKAAHKKEKDMPAIAEEKTLQIPVAKLKPFIGNVRKLKHGDIGSLAASIAEKGLLYPLVVMGERGAEDEYVVVCGSRRLAALKKNGAKFAPCVLIKASEAEATSVSAIENMQRLDLHPIEEADSYKILLKGGHSAETVAALVGVSKGYVNARLRLNTLPAKILTEFWGGKEQSLSAGHYVEIAKMPTEEGQLAAWEMVKGSFNPVTVEAFRRWIRDRANLMQDTPWKQGEVLPAVGKGEAHPKCSTCAKRSSKQTKMFEEDKDSDAGDVCLDSACWDRKLTAHIQKRLDEGMSGVDNTDKTTERYVPAYMAPADSPTEKVVVTGDGYDKGKVIEMVPRDAVPDHEQTTGGGYEGPRKMHKLEKLDCDRAMKLMVDSMAGDHKDPLVAKGVQQLIFETVQTLSGSLLIGNAAKRLGVEELHRHGTFKCNTAQQLWTLLLTARCEPYGDKRGTLAELVKLSAMRVPVAVRKEIKSIYDVWFDAKGKPRANGVDRAKALIKDVAGKVQGDARRPARKKAAKKTKAA